MRIAVLVLKMLHCTMIAALCGAIFAFIAAIPIPAHAQVTTMPPACMPAQMGGAGSAAIIRTVDSPLAQCARWWCPPPTGIGEWSAQSAFWLPTYYLQARRGQFEDALMRGDSAWLAAQRITPRTDANYVRCADEITFAARHTAARPAPYFAFRVAPNAASTSTPKTRPVYEVVDGVRGTKEVARAVVGAGCNHNITRIGDYMAFAPDYAPNRVTLCKT